VHSSRRSALVAVLTDNCYPSTCFSECCTWFHLGPAYILLPCGRYPWFICNASIFLNVHSSLTSAACAWTVAISVFALRGVAVLQTLLFYTVLTAQWLTRKQACVVCVSQCRCHRVLSVEACVGDQDEAAVLEQLTLLATDVEYRPCQTAGCQFYALQQHHWKCSRCYANESASSQSASSAGGHVSQLVGEREPPHWHGMSRILCDALSRDIVTTCAGSVIIQYPVPYGAARHACCCTVPCMPV